MSRYSRQTCAMYSSKSSALARPGAGVARHADLRDVFFEVNFRRRMHDAHTLSAMILRQVARVAAGPPVLMKHTTAAAARPRRAEMRTKKDERRTWCCTGRAWCCRTGIAWCDVLKGFSSVSLSHGDPARARHCWREEWWARADHAHQALARPASQIAAPRAQGEPAKFYQNDRTDERQMKDK